MLEQNKGKQFESKEDALNKASKRSVKNSGSGKKKFPSKYKDNESSKLSASGDNVKPYNDVSYWFQNPEMARDAASVWFTSRVGTPIKGDGANTNTTYVGGVMRINFVPTFGVTGKISSDGYSEFDTSAINQAFIKLDWDIVHANSRNITYEASDIAKYMISCGNVYIMLQDAVRTYCILNKLSVQNPYYGRVLVTACGWDYDELVNKIADFRYRLNQLITLVNRLYVPRVFNIFAAHLNMINRIFADGNDIRSQLYVMVPNGYYTYNDSTGTVSWKSNNRIFMDAETGTPEVDHVTKGFNYLNIIEQRISEILNSEYMGVMGGDILKRYGAENMFSFPYVMENEDLLFVRDDEFNLALENAAFVGIPVPINVAGPTESPRYEVSGCVDMSISIPESGATQLLEIRGYYYDPGATILPQWKRGNRNKFDRVIINLPEDVEATPETIMLSTRMWHHINEQNEPIVNPKGVVHEIDSIGTVLCEYCELYTINASGSLTVTPTAWVADFGSAEANVAAKATLVACSQYHYVPRVSVKDVGASGNLFYDAGKVDNFGFLSVSQMKRLNYVAITSIFTEVNVTPYGFPVKGN